MVHHQSSRRARARAVRSRRANSGQSNSITLFSHMLSWMTDKSSIKHGEKPTNSRITNKSRWRFSVVRVGWFFTVYDSTKNEIQRTTEKKPTGRSKRAASEQRVVGVGRNGNRTCARTAPATPRETDALETFSANCFMSARAAVLTEDLSRGREERG